MKADEGNSKAAPSRHARNSGMPRTKIAVAIALVLALAALYWWLWRAGALEILGDEQALRQQVERLGFWGPLAIIAMMTGAIVLSPIPSGPIALVAGAVYGPFLGTVYVVAGSEAGAIIAFWIARGFGYEVVRRWSRVEPLLERLRRASSQNWLMAIVFASRLVPFISFDAVSYAAGLTPLGFWRFALATFVGVVPISFLLAYFGDEFITAGPARMMVITILVGGITLVPILLRLLWKRYWKD
jgi:uncharacterized membrane protein YdjX (TVP38/TMEM64 family)